MGQQQQQTTPPPAQRAAGGGTYTNPVWHGYFADPFVLRHEGVYYAYGTGHGPEPGGWQFPVLRSPDLANWEYAGAALPPLKEKNGEPFTAYWAPEVAERDGRFYLYFSAATQHKDETHRLRVAVADRPEGPFEYMGRVKMSGPLADAFTIDASPFRDPADGRWYLYFATDFFDGTFTGTGTAVVPLDNDMCTATGEAQTVIRASADWHVYERNRPLYGKTWPAWHTVEGPFVWPYAGKYYCFYSGGNWQTPLYGVGYGVADSPMGPFRDEWNREGPSVLRGTDTILGPGHNSAVVGPDGKTEFMIYHAWDPGRTARRMAIDPIQWFEDPATGIARPRCIGPTQEPQPLTR
jgi:arabinan endo-1,5-alpha-L-arabinosidase